MSMHKIPLTADEEAGLRAHGLDIGTPSQLSDVFRQGMAWAQEVATPMLIWCPHCSARHVDEGEFATKPHHTHACQQCGNCWRPAIGNTVGVQFLPGFKNVDARAKILAEALVSWNVLQSMEQARTVAIDAVAVIDGVGEK